MSRRWVCLAAALGIALGGLSAGCAQKETTKVTVEGPKTKTEVKSEKNKETGEKKVEVRKQDKSK